MKDSNDKNGLGIFGAVVVGLAAVTAAVVAVSKKKKSKKSNSFFKEELVKLPLFKHEEEKHKRVYEEDEEDIFVDEDNIGKEEKKSFFGDEEVSYEEDEEFIAKSNARPIVTPVIPYTKEPVVEEAKEEEVVIPEPVVEEAKEEEVVIPEPVVEEAKEEVVIPEPVVEEAKEEVVIPEPVVEEIKEEKIEPEDISDMPVNRVESFGSFEAENFRTETSMDVEYFDDEANDEPVIEEIRVDEVSEKISSEDVPERKTYTGPIIDELVSAALEEVKTSQPVISEPVAAEPVVAEPVAEPVVAEPVISEPVAAEPVIDDIKNNTFSSILSTPDISADEEDEEDEEEVEPLLIDDDDDDDGFDDDDLEANESYYDWIYNVDEHYSVITDGKWVYCKSNAILKSTSVNKKGEHETIDMNETFRSKIKTEGYCLLKYIGRDSEVVVPSHINGKPVVATLNTFRSNQIVKKITIPSTVVALRRTFYSCYHLDKIIFEQGTNLVYELDSIMCGNNDMDSNTESTTVICPSEVASFFRNHYKLGCPVLFVEQ